MTQEQLKQTLRDIKEENDFIESQRRYSHYAAECLKYIGVVDPELRDKLIYEVFATWIGRGYFTSETLQEYLSVCLDKEHLLAGLGQVEGDLVYTRTFSALIIAEIIAKHVNKPFLPKELVVQTKNTVLAYYKEEKDMRGYTDEKGWAHAMAHGADALMEIAACKELEKQDLWDILMAFQEKICQGEYVFIDREPNRMIRAINKVLDRGCLGQDEIGAWIEGFKNTCEDKTDIRFFHQRINIENFFRCLYFDIDKKYVNDQLIALITKLV